MGFRGSGGLGWRVWLKEYSLRILTLQTTDPQGKQNICARIRAMLTRFRGLLRHIVFYGNLRGTENV